MPSQVLEISSIKYVTDGIRNFKISNGTFFINGKHLKKLPVRPKGLDKKGYSLSEIISLKGIGYPILIEERTDPPRIRKKEVCEMCQIKKPQVLHHIDLWPINNKKSNLMCLCSECHILLHSFLPKPKKEYLLKKSPNFKNPEYFYDVFYIAKMIKPNINKLEINQNSIKNK